MVVDLAPSLGARVEARSNALLGGVLDGIARFP